MYAFDKQKVRGPPGRCITIALWLVKCSIRQLLPPCEPAREREGAVGCRDKGWHIDIGILHMYRNPFDSLFLEY